MVKYSVKLLKREEVAEGTISFFFEKPAGFTQKAGQYIDMTLINPSETDAEGNTRAFSLVSAPHEPDLQIATRMRNTAFKRILKSMPIGEEVSIDGPMGSFVLHNDTAKPAVFLAGGIGITPFVSMIRHAAKEKLPHKIFLFYSNRRPEDAAFLEELEEMEKINSNYKFIGTMTDMDNSIKSWKGETGYITKEMVMKYIPDLLTPIYFVAGPPQMVTAMRQLLNGMGVNDDNIRSEEFAGY